ncbi:SpvB/TcaC N-terminal domain-containing protein [Phaeocystidibacter marisrubri]|uniref:Insecticide toxin TcdB middle/N-terminal domain-containing protein n=1 Tax=Phaeocystidibacter marisrubri TaxID=1577780 RepID=A0A6L3ZEQ4_9FLAO|nr:SpvB/TcaC N-terminal domain-containing protein [Phaeocystidibacter marisrubri]KAB2816301.1 hypothetical protein F8C82_11495 [Phaeocystidibacter marisrubri]GGH68345.1 hypothetical protein GCM10011318_08270 [Phaeocystidibacter marisrubri]
MRTDIFSRLSAFILCFALISNDVISATQILYGGIPPRRDYVAPVQKDSDDESSSSSVSHNLSQPVRSGTIRSERFFEEVKPLSITESTVLVGKSMRDPMSNPRDDFFSFEIDPEDYTHYSHARISYSVLGVSDPNSLPKSINDNPTFGTLDIEAGDQWKKTEMVISLEELAPGKNLMRFGLPIATMMQVEVKDFQVALFTSEESTNPLNFVEETEVEDDNLFSYEAGGSELVKRYQLRDIQVPSIPTDITNVTRGAYAYRFRSSVGMGGGLVGIAIDMDKLPAGKTPKDVSTFYFNYQSRSWVPVSSDSVHVDEENGYVINYVPLQPGSQYFNGVIQTPNMPESSANLQTSLGGIQPANPGTGITTVATPSISRTGEASTSFPIKLPAGRNGMSPSLAITYNSDAGTGWLGVGWNIAVPKISVDTRWGVPTFPESYQEEVYLFNGEPLSQEGGLKGNRVDISGNETEIAERSAQAIVEFFPRRRSSWSKIERHGTSPDTYYWIVTSADQTKSYYGTRNALSSDNNSTLFDPSAADQNIVEWYLTKVIDKWGNTIEYFYDDNPLTGTGYAEIIRNSQQRTLRKIVYAGHEPSSLAGSYVVFFNSSSPKADATVNLRYGFKVSNAHRLESIIVQHGGVSLSTPGGSGSTRIRKYELTYENSSASAFKDQLTSITEKVGATESEFYTNTFSYFPSEYSFEASPYTVSYPGNTSAIGSTTSKANIFGGGLGYGYLPNFRTNNVGLDLSYQSSKETAYRSFKDVTGDGLVDLVINESDVVRYYPGYIDDATGHYQIDMSNGAVDFAGSTIDESYISKTVGTQSARVVSFGLTESTAVVAGLASNYSLTKTDRYFMDMNADGIADWVDNGDVYFARYDLGQNRMIFETNSLNTPNPIVNLNDGAPNPSFDQGQTQEVEVVRMWRAPFDGVVNISSIAHLNNLSEDDNVWVQIDHDKGTTTTVIKTETQLNKLFGTSCNVNNITVSKGDYLYFRVRNTGSPKNDFVEWNPEIAYTSGSLKDANYVNYGVFTPNSEFTLFGSSDIVLQDNEDVNINWSTWNVGPFTDDVEFLIHVTEESSSSVTVATYSHTLAHSTSATITPSDFSGTSTYFDNLLNASTPYSIPTGSQLSIKMEVKARSNVDWKSINWRPDVTVTSTSGTVEQHPAVSYRFFDEPLRFTGAVSFTGLYGSPTEVKFLPVLDPAIFSNLTTGQGTYETDFTIKTSGQYLLSYHLSIDPNLGKIVYTSNDGISIPSSYSNNKGYCDPDLLTLPSKVINDELYFEYTTDNRELAELLDDYGQVSCQLVDASICKVVGDEITFDSDVFLRNEYSHLNINVTGWGSFGWAGNNAPILRKNLKFLDPTDPSLIADRNSIENGGVGDLEAFVTTYGLDPFSQTNLYRPHMPERGEDVSNLYYSPIGQVESGELDRWKMVFSEFSSVYKDDISIGVTGTDPSLEVRVPVTTTIGNFDRTALVLTTVSNGSSVYASGSWAGLSGGGSTTYPFDEIHTNGSFGATSMMDLNGDGYPENIQVYQKTKLSWQETNSLGGYKSSSWTEFDDNSYLSRNQFSSSGGNIGFTFSSGFNSFAIQGGPGVSGLLAESEFHNGIIDFNGDGLGDFYISSATDEFVSSSNGSLRLGNGRRLTSRVNLSITGPISHSDASSISGGFSGKFPINPFSISGGQNWTKHDQTTKFILQDMNADGLPDRVTWDDNNNEWICNFNTGTTFTGTSVTYGSSGHALENSTQSDIVSFRAGGYIPLPPAGNNALLLSLNQTNVDGDAQVGSALMDMNGDGLPDLITDNKNGTINVYHNRGGKGGKLQSISNPLGGVVTLDYELVGHKYGYHERTIYNRQFIPEEEEQDIFWDMPNAKWVLSQVTVDDKFSPDDANDGYDVFNSYFLYDGGMYSRREREFIGFTRIAVHGDYLNGDNNQALSSRNNNATSPNVLTDLERIQYWTISDFETVESTDFTDRKKLEYVKGLKRASYQLILQEEYVETPTFNGYTQNWVTMSVSTYDYKYYSWNNQDLTGKPQGQIDHSEEVNWSSVSEGACIFPELYATDFYSHLDASNYFAATGYRYFYNDYGNVVRAEKNGTNETFSRVQVSAGYDYLPDPESQPVPVDRWDYNPTYFADIIVLTDYYTPGPTTYNRKGVASRQRVFTTSTALSNLRRVTEYDLLANGKTVGQVKRFLDQQTTIEESTSFTFDSYGNTTQIDLPVTAEGDEYQINITYESTQHQYPTRVRKQITDNNSINFDESAYFNYDLVTGLLQKKLDVNGLPMEFYYDEFLRPEFVYGTREIVNAPFTVAFEYFNPTTFNQNNGSTGEPDPLSNNHLPWAITSQYVGTDAPESDLGDWMTRSDYAAIDPDITNVNVMYATGRSNSFTEAQDANVVRSSVLVDGIGRIVQSMREVSNYDAAAGEVLDPEGGKGGSTTTGANVKTILFSGGLEYDEWNQPVISYQYGALSDPAFSDDYSNVVQLKILHESYNDQMAFGYFDKYGRVVESYARNASGVNTFTKSTQTITWDASNGNEDIMIHSVFHGDPTSHSRSWINTRGQTYKMEEGDGSQWTSTDYTYDLLNELQSVSDPKDLVTSYTYDMYGRLKTEVHPDKGLMESFYDAAGNIASIEVTKADDPNAVISQDFSYAYNRLVQKTFAETDNINGVRITYGSYDDGINGAGRPVEIRQGTTNSEWIVDEFAYDELGRRVREQRQIAVPMVGEYTFKTDYVFDSWGRVNHMRYPDGEVVSYNYTSAGDLKSMTSSAIFNAKYASTFIEEIQYIGSAGQRKITYGNGVEREYTYDNVSKIISGSILKTSDYHSGGGNVGMLFKTFSYNASNNISSVENTAPGLLLGYNNIGGAYSHSYTYDAWNRLKTADGTWEGSTTASGDIEYSLAMNYGEDGRITNKLQLVNGTAANPNQTYDLDYTYDEFSHQVMSVADNVTGANYTFSFDERGNMTDRTKSLNGQTTKSRFLWDEADRMVAAAEQNGGLIQHNLYDYNGTRVMKGVATYQGAWVDNEPVGEEWEVAPYVVYAAPHYVFQVYNGKVDVSKHYYGNNKRISTRMQLEERYAQGEGIPYFNSYDPDGGTPSEVTPNNSVLNQWNDISSWLENEFISATYFQALEPVEYQGPYNYLHADCSQNAGVFPMGSFQDEFCQCRNNMEDAIANGIDCPQAYPSQFWYHADIAGHTEFVTDLAGMPYEHFFYLPFGEVAVHQHANNDGYSNPYQFSSSEFDDATGLILMGARYYDPMFSLWMSADPLSSFRSWLTPYNYVANNPVMFVDPSGLLESSIKTGDENPGDFPPCEETSLQEMSPFPLFWAAFYLALANYLSSDSDDVIVTDDDGKDWTREDLEELLAQADAYKENQLALASTNPKFVARAESSLQDDEAKNCPNCPIPSRSFLASNMQEGITTYAGDGEGNFVYYHPDGTVEFDDTGDPGDKILSEATGTALMIAPAVQINQARTALSTVDEVVDAADEGAEYIDEGIRMTDQAFEAANSSANIGTKLEYVFGNGTGTAHNIDRSRAMLRQLESVGIFDNAAGRSLLKSHLESVYSGTKGILQSNGRYLRESLLMGPNGGLKVESIWEGNRLITVKLLGRP